MAQTAEKNGSGPLTVRDAANFLDVHPTHVTLLLRRGSLDGRKWGASWMVDPESAARYMEKCRKPTMGRPRAAEREKTA